MYIYYLIKELIYTEAFVKYSFDVILNFKFSGLNS